MSDSQANPEGIQQPKPERDSTVEIPRKPSGPSAAESLISPKVALDIEATQLGKFSAKGGTGWAAEDANFKIDLREGRTAEQVGLDNAKNGADRIVDGVAMQTKYFNSASKTISATLDKEGLYRYGTMPVEVPKDQYEKSLKLMEKLIADGKVPGVTNPAEAPNLVRQGNVTYRQARNIARAGNIDSMTYDARNSVVVCSAAFGIGFVLEFGAGIWRGESNVGALKNATVKGLQTAGVAFLTSVGSAQLLRTQSARVATVVARKGVKLAATTSYGKTAIHKIAEASLGKAVTGAAAVNHVAKLLRSNAITGAVTVTVMTLPDLYKASISGSASWAQLGKNLVVNTTGVVAGAGGWAGGMALGAAAGSVVPVVGTAVGGVVGGAIGAMGLSMAAGMGAKKAMDCFVEDDVLEMQKLLNAELVAIANDHLLTQAEFDQYLALVGDLMPRGFLGDLHAAKDRPAFVRAKFEAYAFELIKKRKPVTMVPDEQVLAFIEEMLDKVEAGEPIDDETEYEPATYVPNFVLPADMQKAAHVSLATAAAIDSVSITLSEGFASKIRRAFS